MPSRKLGTADHLSRRERVKCGWPQSLPDDAATRYHKHDDPCLIEQTFPVIRNESLESFEGFGGARGDSLRNRAKEKQTVVPIPVYGR